MTDIYAKMGLPEWRAAYRDFGRAARKFGYTASDRMYLWGKFCEYDGGDPDTLEEAARMVREKHGIGEYAVVPA